MKFYKNERTIKNSTFRLIRDPLAKSRNCPLIKRGDILLFMNTSPAKGTFDVLPLHTDLWKDSLVWQYIERTMREVSQLFGLNEIKTPIFENINLFKRSVGDESDIVSKEMYEFQDKGKRELALRPEGTASTVRALIHDRIYEKISHPRIFYFGPMFRYERSQKGRYRQHYQFGVELIGSNDPFFDVEGIEILWEFYQLLGIKNITLHLNSIGDLESRNRYREQLVKYLTPYKEELSPDSKRRLEKNPLRILDSKEPIDQKILQDAPTILTCLTESSSQHFTKVKKMLDKARIPFLINAKLVRGLDYYSQTVFEIKSSDLGAQDTLGAGGRYNGLFKMLSGPDLPAFGFATGFERIAHTLTAQNAQLSLPSLLDLTFCPLNEEAVFFCQAVARRLRKEKISCNINPRFKKISQSINLAIKLRSKHFIAIGAQEIDHSYALVKTLNTKEETQVNISQIGPFIHENRV